MPDLHRNECECDTKQVSDIIVVPLGTECPCKMSQDNPANSGVTHSHHTVCGGITMIGDGTIG